MCLCSSCSISSSSCLTSPQKWDISSHSEEVRNAWVYVHLYLSPWVPYAQNLFIDLWAWAHHEYLWASCGKRKKDSSACILQVIVLFLVELVFLEMLCLVSHSRFSASYVWTNNTHAPFPSITSYLFFSHFFFSKSYLFTKRWHFV